MSFFRHLYILRKGSWEILHFGPLALVGQGPIRSFQFILKISHICMFSGKARKNFLILDLQHLLDRVLSDLFSWFWGLVTSVYSQGELWRTSSFWTSITFWTGFYQIFLVGFHNWLHLYILRKCLFNRVISELPSLWWKLVREAEAVSSFDKTRYSTYEINIFNFECGITRFVESC